MPASPTLMPFKTSLMYANTPPNARSSKKKSPRHVKHRPSPQSIQSYLKDIANRKDKSSVILPRSRQQTRVADVVNLNDDYEYNTVGTTDPGWHQHQHEQQQQEWQRGTTAKVLFESAPDQELCNELSQPNTNGILSSTILLEHTMSRSGRSVHFIIRRLTDSVALECSGNGSDSNFSVDVRGNNQQYSFRVPGSQVR